MKHKTKRWLRWVDKNTSYPLHNKTAKRRVEHAQCRASRTTGGIFHTLHGHHSSQSATYTALPTNLGQTYSPPQRTGGSSPLRGGCRLRRPTRLQDTLRVSYIIKRGKLGISAINKTTRDERILVALDCRWRHGSPTPVWLIDYECTTPISVSAIPISVLLYSLHIVSIGSKSFGWRVIRTAKPACLDADEPTSYVHS
jgi:hypothetical protein